MAVKNNINAHYKIVCAECGSEDIMEKLWFNPNTAEVFGWDEDDLCYCKNCGKMTEWKETSKEVRNETA